MTNKFSKISSLIIFYALAFTFIIPAQILAKPVIVNSAFVQNVSEVNFLFVIEKLLSFDGKGND